MAESETDLLKKRIHNLERTILFVAAALHDFLDQDMGRVLNDAMKAFYAAQPTLCANLSQEMEVETADPQPTEATH